MYIQITFSICARPYCLAFLYLRVKHETSTKTSVKTQYKLCRIRLINHLIRLGQTVSHLTSIPCSHHLIFKLRAKGLLADISVWNRSTIPNILIKNDTAAFFHHSSLELPCPSFPYAIHHITLWYTQVVIFITAMSEHIHAALCICWIIIYYHLQPSKYERRCIFQL